MPERVVFTPSAHALLRRLTVEYGPLVFHQSGGCCEGSAPMCYRRGDFQVGANDVLLGTIDGTPFYIGGEQLKQWGDRMQFIIDAVPSQSDSFSLETREDMRFTSGARAL
jgi:uncharacterized protein